MENQKSLGKKEIIECLQEWRENILCDINNEENWGTEEATRFIQREQFRKLDQAIMLINSLGENNNIPE